MSETSFKKLFWAAFFASSLAVVPQLIYQNCLFSYKIDKIKPKIQTCDVIGEKEPEKFYEIDGKRVYLEIDGKPIAEYFAMRKK